MRVYNVLESAQKLIYSPSNWIQDESAVDAKGNPVDPTDENACAWCILGAISKVAGGAESVVFDDTVGWLNDYLRYNNLSDEGLISLYNDVHDHHEVVSMLTDAIKVAKEKDQ